ncbi:hypothetical protein [Vibrio gallicus]|uniref:hypothetical protein n=1 Tax=Vibrio gallicus TaxID=190897 RepID=UPI0021C44782|nr:hypothetical protein [Vibrio gallicus]
MSTQAPTKSATPKQTPTTTDAGLKHHRHDDVEYAATSTLRYTATSTRPPSSSPRRRGSVSTQAPTKSATPKQTPTTTDAGLKHHRHDDVEYAATPIHRLAPSSSPRRRGSVSTQAPTKSATPKQTPTTTDAGLKHHQHDGVECAATSTHRYTVTSTRPSVFPAQAGICEYSSPN